MTYEELKREISERPITQLPGLLLHVARLCAGRMVFKDKNALLSFIEKVFDFSNAGHPYEPKGFRFYSQSRKQEMILVSDDDEAWAGWICYQHPDGQWVSLRKATPDDHAELANAIVKAHHS